jgi:hypothetical protein
VEGVGAAELDLAGRLQVNEIKADRALAHCVLRIVYSDGGLISWGVADFNFFRPQAAIKEPI